MKLLTIDSREVTGRPGVLLDSGDILDLATAPSTLSESQWIPHSIVSVIAAGRDGLERVARLVAGAEQADRQQLLEAGTLLPYSGTALLAPVRGVLLWRWCWPAMVIRPVCGAETLNIFHVLMPSNVIQPICLDLHFRQV